MDLRKHGFWLLLGAIVLAEAVFYGVGVLPKDQEIDRLLLEIRTRRDALDGYEAMGEKMPTPDLVKHYEEVQKRYRDERKTVVEYYLSRDQEFEPFSDGNLPGLDEYRAEYSDKMNTLVRETKEKIGWKEEGAKPDGPFKREKQITVENLRLVEKRYAIQKDLADIAVAAGVTRIAKIQMEDLARPIRGLLPHRVHPVTFEVECAPESVPEVVASVLRGPLPYRLRGVTVDKVHVMGGVPPEEGKEEGFETGDVFWRRFKWTEEEIYRDLSDDEILPEPPVGLVILLDVVDVLQDELEKEG